MSRRSTLSRRSSQKGSISVKASSSTNGVIATLTSSLADLNTLLDSLRAENAQLKEENKKHLVKEEETLTELQQLRINNTKLRTLYPDNPIDHPSDSEEEQNAPTNAAADAYKLIENDAEHWRARLDEANVRILALTAQHPQFLQSIDRLQRREVRLKQELATVPDLVRKDKETIEQMQLQISFLNEGILTLKAKLKTHETECPELRALWNRYMESTTHGRVSTKKQLRCTKSMLQRVRCLSIVATHRLRKRNSTLVARNNALATARQDELVELQTVKRELERETRKVVRLQERLDHIEPSQQVVTLTQDLTAAQHTTVEQEKQLELLCCQLAEHKQHAVISEAALQSVMNQLSSLDGRLLQIQENDGKLRAQASNALTNLAITKQRFIDTHNNTTILQAELTKSWKREQELEVSLKETTAELSLVEGMFGPLCTAMSMQTQAVQRKSERLLTQQHKMPLLKPHPTSAATAAASPVVKHNNHKKKKKLARSSPKTNTKNVYTQLALQQSRKKRELNLLVLTQGASRFSGVSVKQRS